MSASHLPKTNRTLNFFSTYSVILPVDLHTAYGMLGTAAGHDRVCRLSKLCTGLELLEKDEVMLPLPDHPQAMRLSDIGVRTATATSSSDPSTDGLTTNIKSTKTLTRQHFVLQETVPVIFGLKKKITVVGTLTWDNFILSSSSVAGSSCEDDDSPVEALYESLSDYLGVLVWKLRTFDKVNGEPDKTRITERVEGWAPALPSSATCHTTVIQNVTIAAHQWVPIFFPRSH